MNAMHRTCNLLKSLLACSVLIWVLGVSNFHAGSSALLLHAAGNASFIAGQRSSLWSSDSGNYSFGFSSINGEDNGYLLCVWHSADPNRTALWWAGPDGDPSVRSGSTLNFTDKGSLELRNPQGTLLWNSNDGASYAQLQDTGNLVLLQEDRIAVSWQTFDHLRDSLMLFGGLEDSLVANKSVLLQSRSNQSSFSPGRFHLATDAYFNLYLHAFDSLQNDFIYLYASMNTSNGLQINRDNRVPFRSSRSSIGLERLTLDYDGNLRIYMWQSNVSTWKQLWQMFNDKCMLGSPCGPFGICKEAAGSKNGLNCSCPPGYRPRIAGDLSQGCQSLISFNTSCGMGNATNYTTNMVEVAHSDYLYGDLQRNDNVSLNDCNRLCLNECACMAASFRADSVCFLKGNSQLGYLLNGYTTDGNTLLIKVVQARLGEDNNQGHRTWVVGVAVGVPVALALIVALGCVTWLRCQGGKSGWAWRRNPEYEMDGPVRYFQYGELVVATQNFSEKLGEGGVGLVYKGSVKLAGMADTGHTEQMPVAPVSNSRNRQVAVAVKLLKGDSGEQKGGPRRHIDAEGQFRAEVKTLGNIHHVNLVSLLGYCYRKRSSGEQRLLVYEYMENGSLNKFLSGPQCELLPWAIRYSIALGVARGIAYLHHECNPPIMHCDIKPHNILLDNHFTAKVADFGLARRFHLDSHVSMSGIHGTRGYLAPEWLTSQEVTAKVDVFSFGILLLELVRGFKNVGDVNNPLLDWAVGCIVEGVVVVHQHDELQGEDGDESVRANSALGEASAEVEQSYGSTGESGEAAQKLRLLKIGMWCIQLKPLMRPTMSRVVQLIDGTLPVEDPPIPQLSSDFVLPPHFLLDSEDATTTTTTSSNTGNYSYSVVSGR